MAPGLFANFPAASGAAPASLIALFQPSGILRKFYDFEWVNTDTRRLCTPPLPSYHNLFRNDGGIHTDSAENQTAYPLNAPAFKRHGYGAICGKCLGRWHGEMVKGLRFSKKGRQKTQLFALKGGFLTTIRDCRVGTWGRGKGPRPLAPSLNNYPPPLP